MQRDVWWEVAARRSSEEKKLAASLHQIERAMIGAWADGGEDG